MFTLTPEQFSYWLNGYLEVSGAKEIGPKETQIIRDHLKLVFKKDTPNRHVGPVGLQQGSAVLLGEGVVQGSGVIDHNIPLTTHTKGS